MNKLFYPRPLQPGDTMALTAPSSPVPAVNLKAAIKSVKLLGLNPVVMPSCREHHGYMAGTDAQRASDLNEAFSRKDIAGIFCLRGGFGAMRLLPLLDFDMIRQNPKPLIGYSDITALHTSINKLCGFITFHGPARRKSASCKTRRDRSCRFFIRQAPAQTYPILPTPLMLPVSLVLPMLPKAIRWSPAASLAEICLS